MVEQMIDDDPGVSMSFTLYMRLSRSIQVRLGARQDCDLEHESHRLGCLSWSIDWI